MELLEQMIREKGRVLPGDILRVDSFLNHQIDPNLYDAMGRAWKQLFADSGVTKLLTVEASGIGIAAVAALHFGCPAVFAKKSRSSNVPGDVWSAKVHSYTRDTDFTVTVAKAYLTPADRILLIDDFLANGEALMGLKSLADQAGATVVGAGIAIEKAYQPGGERVRAAGIRVESLARIASMGADGSITFC